MKIIRDAQTLFGMLESGELNREFSAVLQETQQHLLQLSNDQPAKKFKATVKLEMSLTVANGMITIENKIPPVKLPELPRRATVYFLLDDGALSTEHPQQMDWVGGPREIDRARQ